MFVKKSITWKGKDNYLRCSAEIDSNSMSIITKWLKLVVRKRISGCRYRNRILESKNDRLSEWITEWNPLFDLKDMDFTCFLSLFGASIRAHCFDFSTQRWRERERTGDTGGNAFLFPQIWLFLVFYLQI